MTTFYTYDAWVREFKPVTNNLVIHDNIIHFETYGDEVEFVQKQDAHNVWTEVDGDEGTYILSGYHYVNRIHYYITTNPWIEDVEVPTWVYYPCLCRDETENGDPDPECRECNMDGVIDVDCDTFNALVSLYGKDAKIVS
jgi:hypothetical protein